LKQIAGFGYWPTLPSMRTLLVAALLISAGVIILWILANSRR
jgi:hypothetical protein